MYLRRHEKMRLLPPLETERSPTATHVQTWRYSNGSPSEGPGPNPGTTLFPQKALALTRTLTLTLALALALTLAFPSPSQETSGPRLTPKELLDAMVTNTFAAGPPRPLPPPPPIRCCCRRILYDFPNPSQVRYGHSDKYASKINETLAWPNDPRELCAPHRDALDEYQARVRRLQSRLVKLKDEKRAVEEGHQTQQSAVQTVLDGLHQDVVDRDAEIARLYVALDKLEAERGGVFSSNASLKDRLGESEDLCTELSGQVASLKEHLTAAEGDINLLNEQCSELRNDRDALAEHIEDAGLSSVLCVCLYTTLPNSA